MFSRKKIIKSESEIVQEQNIENAEIDIKPIEECNEEAPINREEELANLLDDLINDFIISKPTFINAVERGLEDRNKLKDEVEFYIKKKLKGITEEEKTYLVERFETYIWGYGPLQELIDSDTITDIKTIDYDNVRIKEYGIRKTSSIKFKSRDSLKQYINYVAIKNKATLSEINAIQKVTDKTTSDKYILRINISSEFVNSVEHPYLVIRKIPKFKYTMEDLKEKDMFNEEILQYLNTGIKGGLSIFAVGKGGSGKTTLMNALLDQIPDNKSGLVIQEAEELHSKHPDLMFQKVKMAKAESKIQYTLKDLSINGLLTDLDYFIIGEIKGEEAFDMVNAIFTGHTGLSSLHVSSAEETPLKLIHYIRYNKFAADMRDEELYKMFTYIDTIVFMKDFKCFELTEIAGWDSVKKELIFNPVFKYEVNVVDGKMVGSFIKMNDSCKKIKDKIMYSNYANEKIKGA